MLLCGPDGCPNVRHQEMTNAVNLVDGGVTVTRETLLSGILAARWTQYNNTNWDTSYGSYTAHLPTSRWNHTAPRYCDSESIKLEHGGRIGMVEMVDSSHSKKLEFIAAILGG